MLDTVEVKSMTSDDFFEHDTREFGVIFIDGLHVYEQVIKDIVNAANRLSKYGYIIVHDCLPENAHAATREWHEGVWNGDVWKALYDIHLHYKDLKYYVLNGDFGLGIIQKKRNADVPFQRHFLESVAKLDYQFFSHNALQELNIKGFHFFIKELGSANVLRNIYLKVRYYYYAFFTQKK